MRLSGADLDVLSQAAARAGLALPAYIVGTGLDAAEHRAAPIAAVRREALAGLIRVAGLVRRAGVNLNQAVARLNTAGAAGPDLGPSADYRLRVALHAGAAAARVSRALRLPHRGTGDIPGGSRRGGQRGR